MKTLLFEIITSKILDSEKFGWAKLMIVKPRVKRKKKSKNSSLVFLIFIKGDTFFTVQIAANTGISKSGWRLDGA